MTSSVMKVDAAVLSELRGIQELSDLKAIRGRLAALIAACEEPSSVRGVTTSASQSEPRASPQLRDAIEGSNAAELSALLSSMKAGSSYIVDEGTGVTALHRAVEIGNMTIVDLLLKQVDEEARVEKTLHSLAGEMLVQSLKRRVNRPTSITGYTPLHFAVSGSNDKVVAELLRRGADPDLPSCDDQRVTPFLLACELGQEMAVRMMLKVTNGACADRSDAQGNNGLHLAAENGHAGIAEVLMGVLPSLAREENKDEKTPAALARENGFSAIAELIDELDRQPQPQSGNGGGFFFG